MLEEHAKLAELIRQAGGISGRKRVQKVVYILQKLGFAFHESYHLQIHGPYSEELTLQMEELCEFGFLLESANPGNESVRYTLSESGTRFLNQHRDVLPDLSPIVRQLAAEKASFLELVAGLLYFETLPADRIFEKICTLNKKAGHEQISNAKNYIESLKINQAQILTVS
ncbi:MAG: YwgA family protein [Sporolactobacillus sp.]